MNHRIVGMRVVGWLVLPLSLGALVACSSPTDFTDSSGLHHCAIVDPQAAESGASWADVVRWDGRTYSGSEQALPTAQRGQLLGQVTCDISTSGLGANTQLRNGDATVPSGSSIYQVLGSPIAEKVAVERRGETIVYVYRP